MYIRINEAAASKRRVYFALLNKDGSEPDATGVVTQVSINGATEVAGPALVRDAGVQHYAELSGANATRNAGDFIMIRVPGSATLLGATARVDFGADDVYAAAETKASIAEEAALTVAGAKDLKFDDTTGTSLVITRKSTTTTLATVPLRRADRTQPIVGNG
jgi:hypothetical protein